MKKRIDLFLSWLSGPKSDFFLFVVLLVLINLVSANTFFRIDLTRFHSYSLSSASRELVQNLEQPLSVQVFFSEHLPAPYNGVERYMRDLLQEYAGAGNKRFSYEFFDMEKPENRETAQSYGISMIQIREVKDDEVGYRNAWMGLALTYSDRVEVLDNLVMTEGLEYRLTTSMAKMMALTNSLAGLTSKVQVTLYATERLADFGIAGFNKLEKEAQAAYSRLNRRSMDKIEWQRINPVEESFVDEIATKYGIQKINWSAGTAKDGSVETGGAGVLGIVLEYEGRFRTVPIELTRTLFGGYAISGLDTIEDSLADNLRFLMANSVTIGYVTGHGELELDDPRSGPSRLAMLVSDTYTLEPTDLSAGAVSSHISSLIVNGPRETFSESEKYVLDQFLMRGGSVFMLIDPFEEMRSQDQMQGGQSFFVPVTTGLEPLLERYGVSIGKNYVLDKNCYEAQQQGVGKIPLYYVPVVGKDGLNAHHPISQNLGFVLFLQAASVDTTINDSVSGRTAVTLASSSPKSWLMADQINLSPYAMRIPEEDSLQAQPLAVLLEGTFESAFSQPPNDEEEGEIDTVLSPSDHLSRSVQPGKLLVIGTSAITTPQVMDEAGQQPVALFVRNAIDYLNGRADFARMRTKGLSLDTLENTTPRIRSVARALNLYGVPVLAALAGLIAWRRRIRRRRKIQESATAGKGGVV